MVSKNDPVVQAYFKKRNSKAGKSKSPKKIASCLKNLEKAHKVQREAFKKMKQDGQ